MPGFALHEARYPAPGRAGSVIAVSGDLIFRAHGVRRGAVGALVHAGTPS